MKEYRVWGFTHLLILHALTLYILISFFFFLQLVTTSSSSMVRSTQSRKLSYFKSIYRARIPLFHNFLRLGADSLNISNSGIDAMLYAFITRTPLRSSGNLIADQGLVASRRCGRCGSRRVKDNACSICGNIEKFETDFLLKGSVQEGSAIDFHERAFRWVDFERRLEALPLWPRRTWIIKVLEDPEDLSARMRRLFPERRWSPEVVESDLKRLYAAFRKSAP